MTRHQIEALSVEAAAAGDLRMAMICDLALGGRDALVGAEPGTDADDLIKEGMTQTEAVEACREALAAC